MVAPSNPRKIGFAAGFGLLFTGLKFAYAQHRGLARFYLPPMLFGTLMLIAGWALFAHFVDDIVAFVWSEPENWALHLLWKLASFLVWIVCAAGTALIAVVLMMIAAAPLSDVISERVEGILGSWTPRPFGLRFLLRDLGATLLLELRRALIKVAWLLPLFLASLLIPVIGQIAYMVIGGYLLAKFLGMDYVDWCLARRGYGWRERFAFAKRNRWALVGFGSAVMLAMVVPFGFIAVWPGAVAGGTILCLRLEPEDKRGARDAGAEDPG
jgi:CysZ protein